MEDLGSPVGAFIRDRCVVGVVQRIDGAPQPPGHERNIQVFEEGSRPPRSAIMIAAMGAVGNSQPIPRDSLKKAIIDKSKELGADLVVLTGTGSAQGPTVHAFSGGIGVSEAMQFAVLRGMAYIWAPARLTFQLDHENKVTDVPPGPAADAGLKIGDRVLAVGKYRLTGQPLALNTALVDLHPGDHLTMEVVDPANQTRTLTLVAASNDAASEGL